VIIKHGNRLTREVRAPTAASPGVAEISGGRLLSGSLPSAVIWSSVTVRLSLPAGRLRAGEDSGMARA
jgi:hypothetical protein